MKPIPLHRVAVVRPFTRFLDEIGAPVERGLLEVGLPYGALEDVDNYIPSARFWEFLVRMSYREGVRNLGFRVGQRFGADVADPHMTEMLQRSPTLYHGVLKASEVVNRTVSHCHLGVLQPPERDHAYFYHQPSCDRDNPAIEQIGWYGLSTLIAMTRVYCGPHWTPTEIGVMTDRSPCCCVRETFPHTRMRLSQPFSYITLENSLLSLPPVPGKAAMPAGSPLDYVALPDEFVASLEQVLLSYVQNGGSSLKAAAALCNMSERTLQRRLGEMGTRFGEVLDHVRFRAASEMLKHRTMKATDVGNQLGYSDVAHFSRAFRRMAGVAPKVYRQQHMLKERSDL